MAVEMEAGSMLLKHVDLYGFIYVLVYLGISFICMEDIGCILYFVNTYYVTCHSSIINRTSGYIYIYNCLCRTISTTGHRIRSDNDMQPWCRHV